MRARTLPLATLLAVVACGGSTADRSPPMDTGAAGSSGQGGDASAGAGGQSGASGGSVAGAAGAAGVAGSTSAGGSGGSGAAGSGGVAPCTLGTSSTLPGASLAFAADAKCVYTVAEAAAGVAIPYHLIIAPSLDGAPVTNDQQATCQQSGPGGLFVFEQLVGSGQSYCICDAGLCPPPKPEMLTAGDYPLAFSWDGKNWSGPSDTGNPKGKPFPPGTYSLTVRAAGTSGGAPFVVSATLQIVLIAK